MALVPADDTAERFGCRSHIIPTPGGHSQNSYATVSPNLIPVSSTSVTGCDAKLLELAPQSALPAAAAGVSAIDLPQDHENFRPVAHLGNYRNGLPRETL